MEFRKGGGAGEGKQHPRPVPTHTERTKNMPNDLLSDALAEASTTVVPPEDIVYPEVSPSVSPTVAETQAVVIPENAGKNSILPPAMDPCSVLSRMASGVDVEVILDGVRMIIHFRPGTDPMAILPALKAADPNVQTHSQFWSKGGGIRETKTAICEMISLRVTSTGAFIDLACVSPDGNDAYPVRVTKKKSDSFAAELRAVGLVSEGNLDKIDNAITEKAGTPVLVMLKGPERFGVKFFSTDDNQHFLDSVSAELPKADTQTDKEGNKDDVANPS